MDHKLIMDSEPEITYVCLSNIMFPTPAVIWPKYCRYGVNPHTINQSINISINQSLVGRTGHAINNIFWFTIHPCIGIYTARTVIKFHAILIILLFTPNFYLHF